MKERSYQLESRAAYPTLGNTTAPEALPLSPESQIGDATAQLRSVMGDLGNRVHQLRERLGVVLQPATPTANGGADGLRQPDFSVPYARAIRAITDDGLRIHADVADLLDRLGL